MPPRSVGCGSTLLPRRKCWQSPAGTAAGGATRASQWVVQCCLQCCRCASGLVCQPLSAPGAAAVTLLPALPLGGCPAAECRVPCDVQTAGANGRRVGGGSLFGAQPHARALAENSDDDDDEDKDPAPAAETTAPAAKTSSPAATTASAPPPQEESGCESKVNAASMWKGAQPIGVGVAAGPGDKPVDQAGAAAEGEGPTAEGTPAAETTAAAPAVTGNRRRLQAAMPRMPVVEAEAALTGRAATLRRKLLNAAAEAPPAGAEAPAAETEAPAEGEGAAGGTTKAVKSYHKPLEVSAPTLGKVSGGPCAGAPSTPASAHAMVNQDIAFGQARLIGGKQYFRVVDMFTPSRSKPQPDYLFCVDGKCGQDDISDAIGVHPRHFCGLTATASPSVCECRTRPLDIPLRLQSAIWCSEHSLRLLTAVPWL
jgi:hypothetical protein